MKNKKNKKSMKDIFALGGVSMNIDSPFEDLAQFQNMTQEAMAGAMSDPTVAGLKTLGGTLMGTGMSMAGAGMSKIPTEDLTGIGKFFKNNMSSINSIINLGQSASMQATGGTIGKASINAEGGEVVDSPMGDPVELEGPSHSQGGIDLEVPGGTEIYSKRLKGEDGKTMADRKKAREKELNKVQKLLKTDPTNATLKKALAKVQSNNDFIDKKDLSHMQFVKNLVGAIQSPKFALGGPVDPLLQKNSYGMDAYDDIFANEYDPQAVSVPNTQVNISPDYIASKVNIDSDLPNMPDLNTSTPFSLDNILGSITAGDALGMGANLFGPNAQMRNVYANKAATPTEQNAFKNFGQDSLNKIRSQYGYIDGIRDEQLGDAELSRQGTINRNNNSARSVNTQRALNLATDAQANELKSNIYNQFAAQTMGIIGQEAGQMAQNDQARMTGEDRRAERELQNTDNFYSNMGRAISDKYRGIGETGKTLNDMKERNVTSKILENLFANFSIDPMTGELIGKPSSTEIQKVSKISSKIKK